MHLDEVIVATAAAACLLVDRGFLISCDQRDGIRVVITSFGPDGLLGTADDIGSKGIEEDADAHCERFCDAGHLCDSATAENGDGSANRESPERQGIASRQARIKHLEHILPEFGWRLAHSPEDDRLTTIVKRFMNEAHIPLPDNSMFVISKRKRGWGISVLDFEAFLKGDRPQFDTYRIGYRRGRLELLYIEAGI